jgi:hypothetical protein
MAAAYIELLKHPFWQRKKNGILERDNYTCQWCTDTLSNLQVHHLFYLPNKLPWEYPDEALLTLCEVCHQKAEFYKWLQKQGQSALIRFGLGWDDRQEVMLMIKRRVKENHNSVEVLKYIEDIKKQLNG